MIEFPPYDPLEQHSPYNEDLKSEVQDLEEIDKGLKRLSKDIGQAELRFLICDMLLLKEKPTQEVLDKYVYRIGRLKRETCSFCSRDYLPSRLISMKGQEGGWYRVCSKCYVRYK